MKIFCSPLLLFPHTMSVSISAAKRNSISSKTKQINYAVIFKSTYKRKAIFCRTKNARPAKLQNIKPVTGNWKLQN